MSLDWAPALVQLVVQLTTSTSAHSIKIFVALDLTTLGRLQRSWPSVTVALRARSTTSWRCKTAIATIGTVATVAVLPIVWSSTAVESLTTATHSSSIVCTKRGVPAAAHGRVEHVSNVHRVLHTIARHGYVHIGKVETARCARCLDVVAHREMTIAVCVTTRGSDMCRVNDIAVHKLELLPG